MTTSNVITSDEVWKDIPGYEGYYQVSSFGRVKSLSRLVFGGPKRDAPKLLPESIKKTLLNRDGYECVGLYLNGKELKFKVHRLVAIAFIPNTANKECVDHMNALRSDNRVENLKWCSRLENSRNPITAMNMKSCRVGVRQVRKHKIAKVDPVTLEVIQVFDSVLAAADSLGAPSSWLCKARKLYPRLAYGFYWKTVS